MSEKKMKIRHKTNKNEWKARRKKKWSKLIAPGTKQVNDTNLTSRNAFKIHKNARISTPFTENLT